MEEKLRTYNVNTNIKINKQNLDIEGEMNVIYTNAEDVIAMMEVGHYFEVDELVEEFQLIGINIDEKCDELLREYKLNDKVEEVLNSIREKANFFMSIDKEVANEKVISQAKEIKFLVKKIIKNVFEL